MGKEKRTGLMHLHTDILSWNSKWSSEGAKEQKHGVTEEKHWETLEHSLCPVCCCCCRCCSCCCYAFPVDHQKKTWLSLFGRAEAHPCIAKIKRGEKEKDSWESLCCQQISPTSLERQRPYGWQKLYMEGVTSHANTGGYRTFHSHNASDRFKNLLPTCDDGNYFYKVIVDPELKHKRSY